MYMDKLWDVILLAIVYCVKRLIKIFLLIIDVFLNTLNPYNSIFLQYQVFNYIARNGYIYTKFPDF